MPVCRVFPRWFCRAGGARLCVVIGSRSGYSIPGRPSAPIIQVRASFSVPVHDLDVVFSVQFGQGTVPSDQPDPHSHGDNDR